MTDTPETTAAPGRTRHLSGLILAGGRSERMGEDKAFLTLGGRTFVATVAGELSKISDDIVVVVGRKSVHEFARVLPPGVRLVSDTVNVSNPIGGIISGFDHVRDEYAAVVACDLPLLRSELIARLHDSAQGRSAAVPIWENGDIEPLCSVYRVSHAKQAGKTAMEEGMIGPRYMIGRLEDVRYVPVSELRRFDRELGSFTNINTSEDYASLRAAERRGGGATP